MDDQLIKNLIYLLIDWKIVWIILHDLSWQIMERYGE